MNTHGAVLAVNLNRIIAVHPFTNRFDSIAHLFGGAVHDHEKLIASPTADDVRRPEERSQFGGELP